MLKLPHWNLTNKQVSIYDTESSSALQMVAKLYGAMSDLITEYNNFADNININLELMEANYKAKLEEYKTCVEHRFEAHREAISIMMKKQDARIESAKTFMQDNIYITTKGAIAELVEAGEIVIDFTYNASEESLTLDVH